MTVGILGGVITGVSLPAFNVLFGRLLDSVNETSGFTDTVNQLCLIMLIVACFNLLSGFMQVGWLLYFACDTKKLMAVSYCIRYIVGQLLENVKLKSFGKDMFELFYPKKLDGLIHVVQVSYQPKLQNLLEK